MPETAEYCGAYILEHFLQLYGFDSTSLSEFDYSITTSLQVEISNTLIAGQSDNQLVFTQSMLSSAVFANVMTRLEFMRYVHAELSIAENTELCRLFDLPNYDVIIDQTYIESSYADWQVSFAAFDWTTYTFSYATCTPGFYQQLFFTYFDSLGLAPDHVFIVRQAICNWDISSWDFTFRSFQLYMESWFSFYSTTLFADYQTFISGFNAYIFAFEFEPIMVRLNIMIDLSNSGFVITQGFYDAFIAITDWSDAALAQFGLDWNWSITVTYQYYLTCGVPNCGEFDLSYRLWDFYYDHGAYSFEAYQFLSFFYDMGFSANYIYQFRWFYINDFQFNWTTGNTLFDYVFYVREFTLARIGWLIGTPLSASGSLQFEGLLYSAQFGAALQRMYCFNVFSGESASLLLTWYSEWTSFGYGFDVSFYTNWGITVGSVDTAPLNIFQGCVMEFFGYARTSLGLTDATYAALQSWILSIEPFTAFNVQTFFRGDLGTVVLGGSGISTIDYDAFTEITYSAEFSSLLFVLEILTQFQSRVGIDLTYAELEGLDFSTIDWANVRSFYTYDVYTSYVTLTGASTSVITVLSDSTIYSSLFDSISVDLQPWKVVVYDVVLTNFGWMTENDPAYVTDIVKEVVRETTQYGVTAAYLPSNGINWTRGIMFHLNFIISRLTVLGEFSTFTEAAFYTNYMTSYRTYVWTVISSVTYSNDETFVSSITATDLASYNFFGHGQFGFAKFFFNYITKAIHASSSLSWDVTDTSRYDLGVILHYIGGFNYMSTTLETGVTFEGYAASYTRTFVQKFTDLGLSTDASVAMITVFTKMPFDSNFQLMMLTSKIQKYVFSVGGDIGLMSTSDFTSSSFYSQYYVGTDNMYQVVSGQSPTATAAYKLLFTSVYSFSFDWTVLTNGYLKYTSPIKFQLYSIYIWHLGMTEVESADLIDSSDFTGLSTDTDSVYDVIYYGTVSSAYISTYSIDTYYNSYAFYQYVVQMEFMRYIEINFSTQLYRYQITFSRFFNTFDFVNAFENDLDVSAEIMPLMGTTFIRQSIEFDLSWISSNIVTSFDWERYFQNVIFTAWSGWGDCSATCDGGTMTNQRVCHITESDGNFGCSGSTSMEASCNEDACPDLIDAVILTAVISVTIRIEVPLVSGQLSAAMFMTSTTISYDSTNSQMLVLNSMLVGTGSALRTGITSSIVTGHPARTVQSISIVSAFAVRVRPTGRRRRSLSWEEMRDITVRFRRDDDLSGSGEITDGSSSSIDVVVVSSGDSEEGSGVTTTTIATTSTTPTTTTTTQAAVTAELSIILNLKLTYEYSIDLADKYSTLYATKKAEIEALLNAALSAASLPNNSEYVRAEVVSFSSQTSRRRAVGDAIAETEIIVNGNAYVDAGATVDDATFMSVAADIETSIAGLIEGISEPTVLPADLTIGESDFGTTDIISPGEEPEYEISVTTEANYNELIEIADPDSYPTCDDPVEFNGVSEEYANALGCAAASATDGVVDDIVSLAGDELSTSSVVDQSRLDEAIANSNGGVNPDLEFLFEPGNATTTTSPTTITTEPAITTTLAVTTITTTPTTTTATTTTPTVTTVTTTSTTTISTTTSTDPAITTTSTTTTTPAVTTITTTPTTTTSTTTTITEEDTTEATTTTSSTTEEPTTEGSGEPTPIITVWSDWVIESCACTNLTGEGTALKTRVCENEDNVQVDNDLCVGDASGVDNCNHCPVLSDWVAGDCICDENSDGNKISERTCTYADGGDAGDLCDVELTMTESCNLTDSGDDNGCPIWGSWGTFTDCSIQCYHANDTEYGPKVRTRECDNGDVNDESGACPAEDHLEDILCEKEEIESCDDHFDDLFNTSDTTVTVVTNIHIDFKVRVSYIIV